MTLAGVDGEVELGATSMPAAPLTSSQTAVSMASPGPMADTNPPGDTRATPLFEEEKEMVRLAMRLPVESRNVTVSCAVWPTVRVEALGVTVTVATERRGGGFTVSVRAPETPSAVAMMATDPELCAVTTPPPIPLRRWRSHSTM